MTDPIPPKTQDDERIQAASREVRRILAEEMPDDWQDHCGEPGCEDCPPFSGVRQL